MSAFIHGMGLISAQETFGKNSIERTIDHTGNKLTSLEPDYTNWIDPKSIRRMSKIIRTGVAAAQLALQQAGLTRPDAVITGTGLGCLNDTEVFLNKLIENKEEALNPTPFIQSTHNTIGSQIALITQCLGYNQTYTHRAFSFELALEDALMSLNENAHQNILTGGVDELTGLGLNVLMKLGMNTPQGEGAGFFLLNRDRKNAIAEICDVQMIFKPAGVSEIRSSLDEIISKVGLATDEIDLVLGGQTEIDNSFLVDLNLAEKTFAFKNLCGEYSTASAFALWMGAAILKSGGFPGLAKASRQVKNVLICNSYFDQHHTFILLRAC